MGLLTKLRNQRMYDNGSSGTIWLIALGFVALIVAAWFLVPLVIVKAPVLTNTYSIGTTSDSTPQFKFTSTKEGIASYSGDCKSTSTTVVKGENTITLNQLSDGTHSNCEIIATANNKASSPLKISEFAIDTKAPETTATGQVVGSLVRSESITLTCNDAVSGCSETYYAINNGAEQKGTTITISTEGTYVVEYWSKDKSGNIETHKKISNLLVYSRTPSISIETKSGTYSESFDLKYDAAYPDDTCYYIIVEVRIDEEKCDGVFDDVSVEDDDTYKIMVYEETSMGKISSDSIIIDWSASGPSVKIAWPENGETYTEDDDGDTEIELDADKDAEVCEYSKDGKNWEEFEKCGNTNISLNDIFDTDDSRQKLYVRAIDEDDVEGDAVYVRFYYTS